MTDYTEGNWAACPWCRQRYWEDDGPQCNCAEEAHGAELDELRDSLNEADLWDALEALYGAIITLAAEAYTREIGVRDLRRLIGRWEREFPDVAKVLEG